MFQSLRPNSQVFVLHKGDPLTAEVGFVSTVSIPRPKYQIPPVLSNPQDNRVVDIAVKLGNNIVNYNNLDAGADVAEAFSNGENIVITTSKEAMNSELMSLRQKSIDIVESVEAHKKLITDYDKIISDLNPEFAEKEKQKNEITALKEQVAKMTTSMETLMQANQALIEKLNKKEN
jgi:precorrin-6B methylase 1